MSINPKSYLRTERALSKLKVFVIIFLHTLSTEREYRLGILSITLFTIFMFSGRRETTITGHSVWSHNAHVIMQDISHLKLIAMSLLQTSSYVTEQMQTPVTIDVNKFLEAFSIKAEGQVIHPPSCIAGEEDSFI